MNVVNVGKYTIQGLYGYGEGNLQHPKDSLCYMFLFIETFVFLIAEGSSNGLTFNSCTKTQPSTVVF